MRAQLQGAERGGVGVGGVPQRGESQLGMLAGSLGQVPAFSIPASPNAKHSIGDHLERPSNGSDCCWGVKAAWGARGDGDGGGGREEQHTLWHCPVPKQALSSQPGPVPPLLSVLLC